MPKEVSQDAECTKQSEYNPTLCIKPENGISDVSYSELYFFCYELYKKYICAKKNNKIFILGRIQLANKRP